MKKPANTVSVQGVQAGRVNVANLLFQFEDKKGEFWANSSKEPGHPGRVISRWRKT
jgi:hypothetical protein